MDRHFANMGHTIIQSAAIAFAALFLFALAGCAHSGGDGAPLDDRYFEINWHGTIYVTSNMLAIDQIRADKPLKMSIKSRGANGMPIEVEDDGKGLGIRLLAEYDRRHGINR